MLTKYSIIICITRLYLHRRIFYLTTSITKALLRQKQKEKTKGKQAVHPSFLIWTAVVVTATSSVVFFLLLSFSLHPPI